MKQPAADAKKIGIFSIVYRGNGVKQPAAGSKKCGVFSTVYIGNRVKQPAAGAKNFRGISDCIQGKYSKTARRRRDFF